ncbi:MAG: pyridoxine 4-oxidase, partial [Mesorhizobium sp.]
EVSPVVRAYMAAGQAMGVPVLTDHNSGELAGTSPNSLNIRAGKRLSVADAYLPPEVMARPNLALLTSHEVEHLVLEGQRATGVAVVCDGASMTISADRVVLCAGAVSSPLILMRSGIGDPDTLKRAGIR